MDTKVCNLQLSEDGRLSIRNAAKAIGQRLPYVRQLIESGKVRAWRKGGSDKLPRLVVDVAELKRVVDRETLYVPAGVARRQLVQKRKPFRGRIDPSMADL